MSSFRARGVLTTLRDRDALKQLTLESALDLLAMGLDPEKATLFVQSDVPEISELYWLRGHRGKTL